MNNLQKYNNKMNSDLEDNKLIKKILILMKN